MSKTKIKFKTKLFAFQDMLVTKNMSSKSRNYIKTLPTSPIRTNYHVNKLANSLHPNKQEVLVADIITYKCGTKTFILKSANHKKLAYFRSGQYLSVIINIKGVDISRPFSISSSPNDAIERGFYAITVKPKHNGYVSEYMLKNIKIGDHLVASGPEGDFYYNSLRDPKHILAIAAGSGITPFISMAKAIVEKTEAFNLTIILRNKTCDSNFFLKELQELEAKSDNKVNVVHILSREQHKDYNYGPFTLEFIKQYMKPNSAIWMCGPKKMYSDLLTIVKPLKLSKKNIRIEYNNDIGPLSDYPEYKNSGHQNTYKINIKQFDNHYSIIGSANDTILVSLQKAKISSPSKCLSGICSWCRVKIVRGQVFTPNSFGHPRAADHVNDIYYSCATFPLSDIDIEVS